jgi:predicted AlkP superfamily phosphohydrolase/phosphomutase
MNEQTCPARKIKVLVVGLDGGNWTGLTPLLEAGIMPNLKSLIARGSSGILESTIPPATAPAWSSFQTGKYPNRHGIIDFFMYRPWSYETEFTTSNHLKGRTLWKLLSDSGKRVIAVNLPMTYPPEKVNGVVIPGFDAPDTVSHSTYPEGILETIEKKMGSYRHYRKGWNDQAFKAGGLENLIRELWAYTDTQVDVVKFLMGDSDWDVCMYHFQAHDALQHYAWELIDQNAPPYKTKPENQKKLVKDFYKRLDERIGELVATAGPDAMVVVLSDHGFQTLYRSFHINNWLRDKGYLRESKTYFLTKIFDNIVGLGKRFHVPVLKNIKHPIRKNPTGNFRKINFKESLAYAYSYRNNFSFLVFNNSMRDRIASIEADLLALADGDRKTVRAVYPWYDGSSDGRFKPDLVVEFEKGYGVIQKITSRTKAPFQDKVDPGHHAFEGMFCVVGNNIKQGFTGRARLVDMMPTILHMVGNAIPDDLDGRVISEIFQSYRQETYLQSDDDQSSRTERGKEDFDKVAARLESLGYI